MKKWRQGNGIILIRQVLAVTRFVGNAIAASRCSVERHPGPSCGIGALKRIGLREQARSHKCCATTVVQSCRKSGGSELAHERAGPAAKCLGPEPNAYASKLSPTNVAPLQLCRAAANPVGVSLLTKGSELPPNVAGLNQMPSRASSLSPGSVGHPCHSASSTAASKPMRRLPQ